MLLRPSCSDLRPRVRAAALALCLGLCLALASARAAGAAGGRPAEARLMLRFGDERMEYGFEVLGRFAIAPGSRRGGALRTKVALPIRTSFSGADLRSWPLFVFFRRRSSSDPLAPPPLGASPSVRLLIHRFNE
jgi:hypothetical protein